MGFIDKIESYFKFASNKNKPTALSNVDKKQPLLHQLQMNYINRSKMEVDTWRKAIDQARSPVMPHRIELLKIFRDALLEDLELKTAIRNALVECQAAPYIILDQNGKEDKKAKEYFQTAWFTEYVKQLFNEELYGYVLIEFDPKRTDTGEFKKVHAIPFEHYKPETNEVLFYPTDYKGTPVDDLIKQGMKLLPLSTDANDLGILALASLAVIRKKYTITDWSVHNEKLGKPFIWLQTPTRDKKELNRRSEFLENFADNNWGIGDLDEKFNFLEPGNVGNRHLAYQALIDYCDKAIIKLINGQTGTTENGGWAGTAQVQERVMGQYTKSRLAKFQHFTNDALFPFLVKNGYKLEGKKFQYVEIWEDRPLPTPPNNNGGNGGSNNEPPKPTQPKQPEKKKLSSIINDEYKHVNCCLMHSDKSRRVNLASINDIFEQAIKNIFDKKIKAGELDKSIWEYNVREMWNGVKMGIGSDYKDKADSDLVKQLKQNTFVFAAFKNHQQQKEIAALLLDSNGVPRSFEDFKREALQISNQYNITHLETEYVLAQRSAAMAIEWQKIEDNRDILPNIKYLTVKDDRVREAHKKLDGVCLPIDDDFWNLFFPPNGWGCRCYTEQTDEAIKEPTYIPDEKEVPPSMRFNAGKQKKIVGDEHPYYDVTKKERKSIVKQLKGFINDLGDSIV